MDRSGWDGERMAEGCGLTEVLLEAIAEHYVKPAMRLVWNNRWLLLVIEIKTPDHFILSSRKAGHAPDQIPNA